MAQKKPLVKAAISITFEVHGGMSEHDRQHYEQMVYEAIESKGIAVADKRRPRIVNGSPTYGPDGNSYLKFNVVFPDEQTEVRSRKECGDVLAAAISRFDGGLRLVSIRSMISAHRLILFQTGKRMPTAEEWQKLRAVLADLPVYAVVGEGV